MDVVLGVAVTGPVARLALVGSRGTDVIDQSVVDLADNPIETLTETVVGTNRLLAGENHRLVGTRLCWTDHPRADQLRRALEDSGVHNVAVLSESQAVAALMRAAGQPGAALVMDDATGTLSMVSPAAGDPDAPPTLLARQPLGGAVGGDVTAALQTMMANLSAHPDAPGEVYLVGASPDLDRVAEQLRDASTMRVQVADDPTFALARGAAIAAAPALAAGDATAMAPAVGVTGDATAMAPAAGDATAMAPAAGLTGDETTVVPAPELAEPQDQQLAYSMADDAGIYPGEMDEYDPEFDDYDADYDDAEEAAPAKLSRRSLVIGNAVIAFAVIGLASLATAIAVAVEPTASRQPVVGVQNGTPGKFMPILPSQQQAPLPPPPADAPNAGFQGGTVCWVCVGSGASVVASPARDRAPERLRDAPTMRVQFADDPTFALARGAPIAAAPALAAGDATAMAPAVGVTGDATAMAPAAGDATAMAPAAGLTGDETTVVPAPELAEPQDQQLAYSMADDAGIYPGEMDEYDPEFDDYDADYDDAEEAAPAKLSRRSLVIGNAVIAFAVIGLASLATAIA
ncbi:hypothetical protein, partial [Mycobacterium avium]|uniref:hypothetical protein n=1 Tax=Mycobacterium avium TaxID=1764 RepID=UPI001E3C91E4